MIIGTDTGLLYLAETTQTSNEKDPFLFKITGPLEDDTGKIIKIHNRCCACGKDLDGDGREDLITAGISYQMGIRTDPDPGGGIYYIINKGRDENGTPVLSVPRPLKILGYDLHIRLNSHLHLQAIDLDKDGEKEIIISNQGDGFKGLIFKLSKNELALEYTGRYIETVSIEENLIDIDGDGYPELVFGGGEEGLCSYRDLERY
jgi:hypothetical protein